MYWSRIYLKTKQSTAIHQGLHILIKRDMEILYDRKHGIAVHKSFIELPSFDVGRDQLILQKIGSDAVRLRIF